jgi:hypothetical protein
MVLKGLLRLLFGGFRRMETWAKMEKKEAPKIVPLAEGSTDLTKTPESQEVLSVWDVLSFKENSQAAHLNAVLGFEEWVEMEEARRRIRELFGIDYKNARSLYPYIKTLVDIGLLETTDIGGKRKWRKKGLLVKVSRKAETEEQTAEATSAKKEKEKNQSTST